MSWGEFLDMDMQEVTNAVSVCGMPKEVVNYIWEKKHTAFEVFD